jgi:hypothetical protein
MLEVLALAEPSAEDALPHLLAGGLEQTPPEADTVLVCTRPPRLAEEARLASLGRDSRMRAWLDRMLVIDASQEELREYFEP